MLTLLKRALSPACMLFIAGIATSCSYQKAACIAAESGNVRSINAIQRAGKLNCICNRHDDTPLHLAAANCHPAAVKALLAGGADPQALNLFGLAPLHSAIAADCTEAMEILLVALPNPDSYSINGSPLSMAYSQEAADLLVQHGADVNYERNGRTALARAVNARNPKMVEFLLTHGANPFVLSTSGQDLIESAKPDKEIMNLLLVHRSRWRSALPK